MMKQGDLVGGGGNQKFRWIFQNPGTFLIFSFSIVVDREKIAFPMHFLYFIVRPFGEHSPA